MRVWHRSFSCHNMAGKFRRALRPKVLSGGRGRGVPAESPVSILQFYSLDSANTSPQVRTHNLQLKGLIFYTLESPK